MRTKKIVRNSRTYSIVHFERFVNRKTQNIGNFLDKITIYDNNIGIIFSKDDERGVSGTGFSGAIRDWNQMDLPNDKDWKIIICKK